MKGIRSVIYFPQSQYNLNKSTQQTTPSSSEFRERK